MITPGGSPGTSFDKGAMTRFNNNQVTAQQRSMPHNVAAQQSLRKQSSSKKTGGPPVGVRQQQPTIAPSPVGNVSVPTGGPQLPPEQGAEFDPEVFKEDLLNQVIGAVRSKQFLESPRVKDAATSVRLKNFMNSSNPNKTPDSRNLLSQVVSRMGLS